MNEEEIKKAAEEAIKALAEKSAQEVAKKSIEDGKFISKEDAAKETAEAITKALDTQKVELESKITALSAEVKKAAQISNVSKEKLTYESSLVKALVDTLVETKEVQKAYAGGPTARIAIKALSPADFGSVANYQDLNNDRLQPVYRNPYAPVYLRNIFPNITTTKENITVWQQQGFEGAAAIWKRGTGDAGADVAKPQVKPKFVKQIKSVDWIAGTTDVPREMIDDEGFLASEIPYTLVYSEVGVFAAENKMILDYIKANAVAFTKDGDYTIGVEKILAAAFGQLGSKYMTPTHILINNWDYLYYLSFNKADGSGEYDFPEMQLKFVDGQMFINNLIALPIPEVTEGEAFVIATAHSRFVHRMEVELKVSEHNNDNFEKNMLTYRAEERVTFYTNNVNSMIKITLPAKPVPPVEG